MSKERLIVVGGDAAGMSAASQAGRLNSDLEILAFERGEYTSHSAWPASISAGEMRHFRGRSARPSARFAMSALPDPVCR
jgi:NADPH-dependent 2,4-dienoyl-CoA reductase/sulfur reductase-like enzyme